MPKPNKFPQALPSEGFVRINQFIPTILPISKSTWWAWVKEGKAPKPIKLGEKTTVWEVSELRQLLDELNNNEAA